MTALEHAISMCILQSLWFSTAKKSAEQIFNKSIVGPNEVYEMKRKHFAASENLSLRLRHKHSYLV